ncbi:hypothetical protein TanjilG_10948 [Lupinus angustifolius]|uniref:Uncharacterized protein n=1 Tax=Lupinus angustifolius TaxID=3871 RepID=A0A1J7HZE1_LUPAN|nr:hypothetical protein TanjilG_10948 [Lupinus angustifolius]
MIRLKSPFKNGKNSVNKTTFLVSATSFTPEIKNKGDEVAVTIKTLQQTVKALEAKIEIMKKIGHSLQLKQKDEAIRKLSNNGGKK